MTVRTETLSYLAEPTIQYLFQILGQVHAGDIQFPRFQRYGVWKPEQRRELLRSIREGIPIGTILLWRTRRVDVSIVDRLGAHQLPQPRKGESTRQYVLDGVQRLSTLYIALFPADDNTTIADDGERARDFMAFYDLLEQDFLLGRDLDGDKVPRHCMPLGAIRDSLSLLKFQRRLKGKDVDKLTERADDVARAFREYKIPVVPLASDDLLFATKSFQRVNTQGTPMSEIHMVNALVYSGDFDLLEQIVEARQEKLAIVGWEHVDDEMVLRTAKALLNIDVYTTQPDSTKEAIKQRPEILREAIEALVSCAKFLREHVGIRSPWLVPYAAQIVLLAKTLHGRSPTPKGVRRLKDWLAVTTYTELFGGNMSASRFDALASELKVAASGKPLDWSVRRQVVRRPLPPTFDFRHARARFLALRMARAGSHNPSDPKFKALTVLARLGVNAVPKLVTKTMTKKAGPWMRGPGARIIAGEGALPALRNAILDKEADENFLRSHLISADVHQLLIAGKYEDAVAQREAELNKAEEDEFNEILARNARLR